MAASAPAIKLTGFTKAENRPVAQRIIMAVDGLEKQGKTHFGLTAPGGVAYLDLDIGCEGVMQKFLSKKAVYVHHVQIPVALGGVVDTVECEKSYDGAKSAYKDALYSKDIRSVVIDTASELWELLRLAKFGKLTQVMPFHYAPVNAEFRDLIRLAYPAEKNEILLHKLKSKYVNDKRTADYERSGFGDTGFLVQCNARVHRDKETGEFCLKVADCRQNHELAEMVLEGVMCNFPMFAAQVFPDSRLEDWE